MNEKRRGLAVLAGIFLIFYALPYLLLLSRVSVGDLRQDGNWLVLGKSILMLPAGVLLAAHRPKLAAPLMTAAVLASVLSALPEISIYLNAEDGMIAVEEFENHVVRMPAYLGLTFLLAPLAELFFAVALFLRGRAALIAAILAAGSMFVSTRLELRMCRYLTGHPSPLTLLLPACFILASLLAGLCLFREKPPEKPGETNDGHSDQ